MTDEAPENLERVRRFLNTTQVSNDPDRKVVDSLVEDHLDHATWAQALGTGCSGIDCTERALQELRTELRANLGRARPVRLNGLAAQARLRPMITGDGLHPVEMVSLTALCAPVLLGWAIDAVSYGWWERLRACPDCQYVFYDSSRNGRRTWCRMQRDDTSGRSCGSIAKARAHRARLREAAGR